MAARGFGVVETNFTVTGGSAFTKNRRPLWSTILVIWAVAVCVNSVANRTSVPSEITATIAVRFTISPLAASGEPRPLRRANNDLVCLPAAKSRYDRGLVSFGHRPGHGNTTSVLSVTYPSPCTIGPGPCHRRIIATARDNRGCLIGHFLAPMCPFRQPRPSPAGHRRSRPPAWLAPVSACQHGL
jgi:hypothetical protein